jgi:uncharacterized damage-inducible protein DinB
MIQETKRRRQMRTLLTVLLIAALSPAIAAGKGDSEAAGKVPEPSAPAAAVTSTTAPLIANSQQVYRGAMTIVRRSAELMPEEKYGFKPVETVRTFGEIVGHIVESQYLFCAAVRGEQNPTGTGSTNAMSKTDLIVALDLAREYCEVSYAGLTDDSAVDSVPIFRDGMPALGVMNVNLTHTMMHYGNLATYLRIQGLVPPSSNPEVMRSLR